MIHVHTRTVVEGFLLRLLTGYKVAHMRVFTFGCVFEFITKLVTSTQ